VEGKGQEPRAVATRKSSKEVNELTRAGKHHGKLQLGAMPQIWVGIHPATQPPSHPARPQKHPLPFVILRRESDTVLCMFQAFRTTFWEHTQMPVCCYHANSNASICICS